MQKILHALLDLVFPPRCFLCQKSICKGLCPGCKKQLRPCFAAAGIDNVDLAFTLFSYDGAVKKLIHKMKFYGKKDIALFFGELLADFAAKNRTLLADVVLPVPCHVNRLKTRGFNQAEVMAFVVSKMCGIELGSAMVCRGKDTKFMYGLKKKERSLNVKDAFFVNVNFQGKAVLIVDDIITTGATISELARILKKAGAGKVTAIAVAAAEL